MNQRKLILARMIISNEFFTPESTWPGGSKGCWINPRGDVIPLNYEHHGEEVEKNPTKFGLNPATFHDRNKPIPRTWIQKLRRIKPPTPKLETATNLVEAKGWIRVRIHGNEVVFEGIFTPQALDHCRNFILSHVPHINTVVLDPYQSRTIGRTLKVEDFLGDAPPKSKTRFFPAPNPHRRTQNTGQYNPESSTYQWEGD